MGKGPEGQKGSGNIRSKFVWILIPILIISGANIVAGYWVRNEAVKRVGIRIEGQWVPNVFQPQFKIVNARLEWKERIKLESDQLVVQYDLLNMFRKELVWIRISSSSIQGTLLGSWAEMQGAGAINLDLFVAELGIDQNGIREMYHLDAKGPEFQFRIQQSDTIKGRSIS